MSASQFTIYSSSDGSAPQLSGTVGSLLAVLDAVLVNGYGTKTAAGWTKPFANASNIGCYKQGAGAGFGVVVNDAGPTVANEAIATGWESIAGVGSPVGTGSGQFPLPAQSLTNGHVVWRKSSATSSTTHPWIIYADASTFYLHVSTGDAAGTYLSGMFGDFFSLAGSGDAWRCMIIGRTTDSSAVAGTTSGLSGIDGYDTIMPYNNSSSPFTVPTIGHFVARTYGGTGASLPMGKIGDVTKSGVFATTTVANSITGIVQPPNGPDNSYYISPLWIYEPNSQGVLRGRLRGMWQVCHPVASFSDGQTFSGGGDYSGKAFKIVKQLVATGFVAMETSNTVETN